jgi:hypothetical protein
MIRDAAGALQAAGYDTGPIRVLIRVDLPRGYRAMTLEDGAAIGAEAFSAQAMVTHVLEEELLHLNQKAREPRRAFGKGTVQALEDEVHEARRFPPPGQCRGQAR